MNDQIIRGFQRNEITEHVIYQRLSLSVTLFDALLVILAFTFFVSVVKDVPYLARRLCAPTAFLRLAQCGMVPSVVMPDVLSPPRRYAPPGSQFTLACEP